METCVLRRSEYVFKFRSNIFPSIGSSIKKMGFNCLKVTEPLQGGSLLFTTKFSEIPGTHLIDPGRMTGFKGLGVTFC